MKRRSQTSHDLKGCGAVKAPLALGEYSYLIPGSPRNGKPTITYQLPCRTDMKDNGNHCDLLSNHHGPGIVPRPERQQNVAIMGMSFGFRQSWVPVPVLLLASRVTLEVYSISVMSTAMTMARTQRNPHSDPPLQLTFYHQIQFLSKLFEFLTFSLLNK